VNTEGSSSTLVFSHPSPNNEQIVSYLDEQTSHIDTLIQSKQKKITLLKEKRTSLINQIVTKGLNPNVEMKDSGVEWIGEIPRGWSLSQFRHYIKLRHGYQFRDYDFTDIGIKIVKITQLHRDGYLDLGNCSTIDPSRLEDFSDIIVKEKDILMCLTGGTIGKIIRVGKVNEPLLQNYRVGHFSTKREYDLSNNFLFYLMSSNVIIGQIFYEVRETGQPNIGLEDMNRMVIVLPPLSEQMEIVEYLDRETELIDKTVSIEERKIELLKEYKQSLISEVITGKRKVVSDE
jgi:type I restriction enzyme, S subunit